MQRRGDSCARDASPRFLPGPWRLRRILSGREFRKGMPGRESNVNKGTQEWHLNMLAMSSQLPVLLVTKSSV